MSRQFCKKKKKRQSKAEPLIFPLMVWMCRLLLSDSEPKILDQSGKPCSECGALLNLSRSGKLPGKCVWAVPTGPHVRDQWTLLTKPIFSRYELQPLATCAWQAKLLSQDLLLDFSRKQPLLPDSQPSVLFLYDYPTPAFPTISPLPQLYLARGHLISSYSSLPKPQF